MSDSAKIWLTAIASALISGILVFLIQRGYDAHKEKKKKRYEYLLSGLEECLLSAKNFSYNTIRFISLLSSIHDSNEFNKHAGELLQQYEKILDSYDDYLKLSIYNKFILDKLKIKFKIDNAIYVSFIDSIAKLSDCIIFGKYDENIIKKLSESGIELAENISSYIDRCEYVKFKKIL